VLLLQGSLGLSFNERVNHGNESPSARGKMEVLVHFVEEGGQAALKGIKPGDIIVGMNGMHVASAEQMLLLVRTTPRPIVLQLARQVMPGRPLLLACVSSVPCVIYLSHDLTPPYLLQSVPPQSEGARRAEANVLARRRRSSRGAALEAKARQIASKSPLLKANEGRKPRRFSGAKDANEELARKMGAVQFSENDDGPYGTHTR
jgi:membrane-associated protease RseP (regulator of RpoE activity)